MLKIESNAIHNSIHVDADFSEYVNGDFVAGCTVELLTTCLAAITACRQHRNFRHFQHSNFPDWKRHGFPAF